MNSKKNVYSVMYLLGDIVLFIVTIGMFLVVAVLLYDYASRALDGISVLIRADHEGSFGFRGRIMKNEKDLLMLVINYLANSIVLMGFAIIVFWMGVRIILDRRELSS